MDNSAPSQRKAILKWLHEYGFITTIQARDELGIMSPAPRIKELRDDGYNIKTHWTTTIDRAGKKHREAKYILFFDTIKKAPASDQTREDFQMYESDHTHHFIVWQQPIVQAQELSLKLPEMGLNAEQLAFLKRSYAEKQAL